jgi:hypothetical protein
MSGRDVMRYAVVDVRMGWGYQGIRGLTLGLVSQVPEGGIASATLAFTWSCQSSTFLSHSLGPVPHVLAGVRAISED